MVQIPLLSLVNNMKQYKTLIYTLYGINSDLEKAIAEAMNEPAKLGWVVESSNVYCENNNNYAKLLVIMSRDTKLANLE